MSERTISHVLLGDSQQSEGTVDCRNGYALQRKVDIQEKNFQKRVYGAYSFKRRFMNGAKGGNMREIILAVLVFGTVFVLIVSTG